MGKTKNGFIIKEDGTIIRKPEIKEPGKGDQNNGCISNLIAFVVFVLFTTIVGGVIGFFVDKHDSVEMGVLFGALFGIAYSLISLVGEMFNKK